MAEHGAEHPRSAGEERGPALDAAQLARQTGGDEALAREVLEMLAAQLREVTPLVASGGPDTAFLMHRLKGSARALGAFALADRAEALEAAPDEAALREAFDAAVADVLRDIAMADGSPPP